MEEKKEDGMGTLRKDRTLLRDDKKMEKLKAKLHTDDEREFNFGRFTLSNSCSSCTRGHKGSLEPIPAVLGRRRGHPVDKSPVYHRASLKDKQPLVNYSLAGSAAGSSICPLLNKHSMLINNEDIFHDCLWAFKY